MIGRENELARLEQMQKSGKFEFLIMYGRRRIYCEFYELGRRI